MHEVTQLIHSTDRHTTSYLRAGDPEGPLVILVHGWPERAISWRHQIRHLAEQGYLVVAPDMRGYGDSTVHPRHQDYAMEPIVGDMLELLSALGRRSAVWVGHDWGSPVVWSIASHHPEVCVGVANLCVPYVPGGFTLDTLVPLVDRELYPAKEFPAGQWEYFLFYREHFDDAVAAFEADVEATVKLLFRRGNPASIGMRSPTASTRINGGWFGPGRAPAPDLPIDTSVVDDASFQTYVSGLRRNGFFGPDSWYMNDGGNGAYAATALDGGRLSMPVLFLHARYDLVCATVGTRLSEPMRGACSRLTEEVVDSGHWMAQEQPGAVDAALDRWLPSIGAAPRVR